MRCNILTGKQKLHKENWVMHSYLGVCVCTGSYNKEKTIQIKITHMNTQPEVSFILIL